MLEMLEMAVDDRERGKFMTHLLADAEDSAVEALMAVVGLRRGS